MCEKLTLREHLIMGMPIARQSRKIKRCAELIYTLEASLTPALRVLASHPKGAVAWVGCDGKFVHIVRLI
jgi:hypothetical protein